MSDSNVSPFPVDPSAFFRSAIALITKYVEQTKPDFSQESTRTEMALFDQIVAIQLSQPYGPIAGVEKPTIEQAVQAAVHAVTERRKLFHKVQSE